MLELNDYLSDFSFLMLGNGENDDNELNFGNDFIFRLPFQVPF